MSKTRQKKTSFLMSNFLIFGSQLGSQSRKLNSKIECFSLSWANLGQLGHKRRSKTPQESQNDAKRCPKRAQMRPKGVPREPNWLPQSAPIHQKCLKRFMHESLFWWPTVPGFKRGGFQGKGPRGGQEVPWARFGKVLEWFWELGSILAWFWSV